MTTAVATDWTIRWRGSEWTDADLTGQHLATLALISGDDRFEDLSIPESELRAYPSLGYMRLMNLLCALVAVEACDGIDDPDVAQEAVARALSVIQSASADEILGAVSFG